MCTTNQVVELQEKIVNEIIETRQAEMEASIAAKRTAAKQANSKLQEAQKVIRRTNIDLDALEELDAEFSKRAVAENREIEARMNEESQEATMLHTVDFNRLIDAQDYQVLTPVWTAEFDDDDEEDEATGVMKKQYALSAFSTTVLDGGACQDYYNWASGAGSGLFGSGVGQIQSWVYFGFWFKPPTSRFYSIVPQFRFRGYYIVKADDGWFTSKYARTVVSAWTNVHQYNWKGWNSVNVLDVGNDNINVNKRFDDDRYTYNSYLLGGGDWAWISCVIGLYAYARGGGSYVKNDFATGNANYLCVPKVYVY